MKYVKILGLAAMALTALMAMAGTASATDITSPKGTVYTSTIVAENEGTVTLTSVFGGFGAISCTKSLVEGKVEGHGSGKPVSGKISNLTFTGCSGGEVTSPVAKPGSLDLSFVNANEGSLTSTSAEVIIHKTLFGTCTFTTSASGTSLGTLTTSEKLEGKTATLDIKATISSACGNGTWEGSYVVKTPDPFYLDA
jgi:hypothetical protein